MDREESPAHLQNPSLVNPNSDNFHETETTQSSMAPVILEEDSNIVSAAIITLGDDSSDEEDLEQLSIEDEIARVVDALLTDEDESSEPGSDEDTSSGSGSGTIYIGEQSQTVIPVAEIHIYTDMETDSDNETAAIDETRVQVQMQVNAAIIESMVDEELFIDFEDVQHNERRTENVQDGHADETRSESSLLDLEILDEWAEEDMESPFTPLSPRDSSYQPANQVYNRSNALDSKSEDNDQDSDEESFQSCESEDGKDSKMDIGNRNIWKELKRGQWVAKDLSTILDTKADRMIPMPTTYQARKEALMSLFLLLSKVVFFIDLGIRRERIFALIPEKFWLTHFTWTDTRELLQARDKEICINLLTRTKTVLEEWRLGYGFPRVPEIEQDVHQARGQDQQIDREDRVQRLLRPKLHRSDRWLRHIFLDFVEYLPWEDVCDEFRELAVRKVVTMTELCFEQVISIRDELLDVKMRREIREKLVREQLKQVLTKIGTLGLDG
ncbi:uncharacterized protein LY89DRAFT_317088 [Mollisia scopiformis]|uniref:Uncharacterized protein n=1 Tax=Mollisia scopiformis TaxID=149040 RepID=A0A132B9S4_MOLSC|nr:uncharacterized protein LY89DRAFT_317088 [Mollisia scopiformis]KUJ08993.1 hypothetical protein LY89DRAFT_317088 [Mollisia scopiformis]